MTKSNSRLKPLSVLILLFLCFVHLCFSNDTSSLIALRNLMVQRKDVMSTWFDSDTPPCNWTGITCTGSTVHKISLPCRFSPLNLPFPKIFKEFRFLKHLNVSGCGFSGHIYSDFWSLEDLETLDLSCNRLWGELDSESFSNLKKLRRLVLDSNGFSGSLPNTIGQLENLTELSVKSNSFSGRLPDELGNLTKLRSLDLSLNLFSGDLPSSLGNLSKLLFLDASRNRLSGELFPGIGNLKRLVTLELSMNSFSGQIPETIGDLTEVINLNLESCKFTGNIPSQITKMRSLVKLNIQHNNFEGGLPGNIGDLKNLMFFIATSAGISGRIPESMGNCTNLRILDLGFNSLSGPLPDSLAKLESLNSFTLISNHVSGPFPIWVSNWKQVESMVWSKNMFTGRLPPLPIPSLIFLDVSSNKLSGELPDEICNGNALSGLLLSVNEFTGGINTTFRNCKFLTDVMLSGNKLSGEIPPYLGELPLIILELSKNQFHGTIPSQLWESKTLMELSLANNFLEGFIPETIGTASTIERLQLDNNFFEGNIPNSIGELKNLTNLSLHGNKLTGDIPLELFRCRNLISLDLGSNKLTGQIPKSISNLQLLDNLVLSNNQFHGPIPQEICSGFQKVSLPDSEFVQHYGMLNLSYNYFSGEIPTTISDCIIVRQLILSHNELTGTIPYQIASLTNLTSVDLSFNRLSGQTHPRFFSMRNLQGLVISHNRLTGSIPVNFGSMMPNLVKLDLSSNCFNNSLPPSIFTINTLQYLDVSMNSFSGELSFKLAATTSLFALNASNNLFSGALDPSISNLTSLTIFDIHNNTMNSTLPPLSTLSALTYLDLSKNNFQNSFPCIICNIDGLSFVNFSGNNFTGPVPESCKRPNSCFFPYNPITSHHLTHASVLGIVLSASFVFIFLSLIAIFKRKNSKPKNITLDTNSKYIFLRKRPKEPLSINIATFEQSLLRVSHNDILSATENFSKTYIIGDGGFGTVYKALLPEGQTIAVKRLHGGRGRGLDREFLAEMETIGKVKHENLVSLLGYCVFADERFLIYEYMSNGSLDIWLRNRALDWPTRFNICLGSARGIAFLHHGFVPHIIHRDIKSSNILLDGKFEARVSDFGLARIISACESHVSTMLAGTFGYIPPEYGEKMVATTRGDVYSFGVVMLELVTGREATGGGGELEGENLVGWVRWMVGKKKEIEVVDPCFYGSWMWKDQMMGVLRIALACTSDSPRKRPSMLDVVKMLKELKANTGFVEHIL